jgi:hypothetical protein
MYNQATSEKFGSFIIDSPRQEYRKNHLGFYSLNKEEEDLSVSSREIVPDNPDENYQTVQSTITSVSASLAHLLSDDTGKTFTLEDGRIITIFLGDLEFGGEEDYARTGDLQDDDYVDTQLTSLMEATKMI